MIPRSDIVFWRQNSPWQLDGQVEQDLVISRALVELFTDEAIRQNLAFRGGTALYKLYMDKPVRYSEDIDLVQVDPKPIGKIIDKIKERLAFIDTSPRVNQKNRNNTIIFCFNSEIAPIVPLKLKIEINCREHFTVSGKIDKPFSVETRWFSGKTSLVTYSIEELLGTKLRALYQRKKSRDLFDLWYIPKNHKIDNKKTCHCFREYIANDKINITRDEYISNLQQKIKDPDFRRDTDGLLLVRDYDIDKAYQTVVDNLITLL
ncbi:MAG TPA: nucleotidyl transferase AbiEii/AbiGii toxin family protein [Spirochaetia bacterium]|nr:nucleotidyl transferase AbiEii/AbiGii toxin family protein [Spirochaetia bacterium]